MMSSNLSILTNKDKYVTWIRNEFLPLTLATPTATIEQCVDNAVRYWNTHSGYKISQMVNYFAGTKRVQLNAAFKAIARVYPNVSANWIWNEFPTWSLAGIAVLDNIRTDLILATESFRNFNIYAGANFRWVFDDNPDDPSSGGYLYCRNVPTGTTALFVVGTRRVLPDDDIESEYINDWLTRYAKALVKQIEGNTYRKTVVAGLGGLDGSALVAEGKEEMRKLQEDLAKDGRWVAFARRQ